MESRGGINGSSIAKRIGLLAVAAAPLLWAAPNRWTSIGPFGGNARTLAIDPQDPATIYAGTSGGVFKTTNSGASWTPANSGLPIGYGARALVIDPVNSATLYVGGACGAWGHCGIFKSIDGARSWQAVNSGLENSVIVVESLAIDPHNPATLYAGTSACFEPSGAPGFVNGADNLCYRRSLFKTTDGGASWSPANSGLPLSDFGMVQSLAVDPQDSNTVYAGVGGVYKSADGGLTWTSSFVRGGTALAIDPQNPRNVYAADWSGVYKSTDRGGTWSASGAGLPPTNCCGSLALDPQNPGTVYAGGRYDQAYADGKIGIYVSTDGGANWTDAGMPWFGSLPNFPVDPPNPTLGLAVDPRNAGTVYAATGTLGIVKSADRGAHWSEANSGISATEVYSTVLDPLNPGTLYAATGSGLFKTTDRGVNWGAADFGLPAGNIPFPSRSVATALLAIDPQNSSTLYADVLPSLWAGNPSRPVDGGTFKSTDAGTSWSAAGAAPDGGCLCGLLVIDPHSPTTIYAPGVPPGEYGGLYVSTDGAASWTANGSANFRGFIETLTIDAQNSDTLYASTGWQVQKSTDRGVSWSTLPVPVDSVGDCDCMAVNVLAVDPKNSGIVYAAGAVGILKSSDGGATWAAMNLALPPELWELTRALVIDPRDSNNLYVLMAGKIFRSTDGAADWSDVSTDLPITSASSLTLDPNDSRTLYVGTDGGGIFTTMFVQ